MKLFDPCAYAAIGLLVLTPASRAAEPTQPGPLLAAGENDAAWRELFAALAAQGSVHSTFTERRWMSVRKEPIVLHGELRHGAALGLSLHYVEPQNQTMIIDSRGIVLRDARGRSRSMAANARVSMEALLLPVLRFDEAALRAVFDIHAARDGDDWRLDLIPRAKENARAFSAITIFGAQQAVQRLEFRRRANERVEVIIERMRTGVDFSAEEKRRFFR